MINWKNERSDKNLCGYCTGSPPSANCSGDCLNDKESRKLYILDELGKIEPSIEALKERKQDLINSLKVK